MRPWPRSSASSRSSIKKSSKHKFETERDLVGGAAYDKHGVAVTDECVAKAKAFDAVIFGAVGGPQWDKVPYAVRPEAGLLRLRKDLDLFANLRPAICYPALADASSLKRELVEGLDIMIVRELTGGVYFGEPKEIVTLEDGQKRAVDTQIYTTSEIERIAKVAFDLARKRGNKVHSAEKRNVMKTGVLWNEVVTATHKSYARTSSCTTSSPTTAPCSSSATRSSSTSSSPTTSSATSCRTKRRWQPAHSACCPRRRSVRKMKRPESASRCTSPSTARHPTSPARALQTRSPRSRASPWRSAIRAAWRTEADLIDQAIAGVLADGYRTGDIMQDGMHKVGTTEMGGAILAKLEKLAA